MAVRSLHIPAAPSLWIHGTGLIVVTAYCAASYVFNHTALGDTLRAIPIATFVGLHLTFAIAPAAGILGHLAAGRPAVLGWLGLGWSGRDVSATCAAFVFGCVIASFRIGTEVSTPGGLDDATRIFVNLLVASTSEAVVFLGVAANLVILALRNWWKNSPAWGPEAIAALAASALFGLFHLTRTPPLDGFESAPLLVLGWISASAIFVLTRSLIAAIVFMTTMSLIGVMEHESELRATTESGVALAAITLALFIGTLWLTNLGNRNGTGRKK